MAASLWKTKADLSHVKAVQWGKDHEEEAREEYEKVTMSKVTECGLFVSKKMPLFAASPDGILQSNNGLLEIKCPFSLKDSDVNNLATVASSQFFTCSNAKLSLKRTHAYYFQVQLQMYVTGCKFTDFFI
jgi:hypothetical protein